MVESPTQKQIIVWFDSEYVYLTATDRKPLASYHRAIFTVFILSFWQ